MKLKKTVLSMNPYFKLIAVAFVGVSLFANLASAQFTIAADNFDRADGSLTASSPTPGPGSVWTSHSGTAGDLLISSGAAVVQHGVPSEDTHIRFAAQSTGVLSAVFDISVNDDAVIGGTDFEYFAHFMTEGSFNFRSRVDVQAPTGAGDYTLGIASGSSTAEATLTTDFSFNTPVTVTLAFDLDTGIGSLTVGAETIVGTGIFLGENLDSFALRQSDSSNNETITVDNLVITGAVVPEPSTYAALIGLLALGLVMVRRRKA
ncbi:PEP-CTERM sorting domain-containing protein [Puniceicoccales bacterium CK1056]|uniref:PEP-CTERM sorting domain-containing protein n=1 Tax=Oceanipulchritudo coccoides TaxID=2706888 RepID=A0A6B2M2T8_9BACT|nr:PEP-CTERM sorting domain-containing protein [Oceanipulchritudo coccoides]NDV63063.1 PEP-CTERM sorting domain-containing protein [Oceanipulchritudo coccoides]